LITLSTGLGYQRQPIFLDVMHISFLSYKLSSLTDDQITIGLLYADTENYITPFISEERLKILKKIVSPHMYKHFYHYVKALQRNKIKLADLDYLSVYQNGFIKITKPGPFAGDIDQAQQMFEKFVNKNYKEDGN
jgi:hypothetical protein